MEERDPILAALASTAFEMEEFELDMTLTLGGSVVTGLLIGRGRWFRELTEQYGGQLPLLGTLQEHLRDEAAHESKYEYLHLKDVTFVTDRPTPRSDALFWRGRTNAVDGWSFGRMIVKA